MAGVNLAGKDVYVKSNIMNFSEGASTGRGVSLPIPTSTNKITGTAQETIKAGNAVFIDSSSNVYIASPLSTDNKPCNAIATEDRVATETIICQLFAELETSLALTKGKNIYLSEYASNNNISHTVKEIASATYDTIQRIGIAGEAGKIYIYINTPIYL